MEENQINFDFGHSNMFINNHLARLVLANSVREKCTSKFTINMFFREDLFAVYTHMSCEECLHFINSIRNITDVAIEFHDKEGKESMDQIIEKLEKAQQEKKEKYESNPNNIVLSFNVSKDDTTSEK